MKFSQSPVELNEGSRLPMRRNVVNDDQPPTGDLLRPNVNDHEGNATYVNNNDDVATTGRQPQAAN